MTKYYPVIIKLIMLIALIVIFAICLHSLEEIHYLKSFFPDQFTVEEAFYASAIELIKILIITLPFVLLVATGLFLLRNDARRND